MSHFLSCFMLNKLPATERGGGGVGDGSVGEGILWYVALIQMRLILADHTCTKPLDCQH